MYIFTIGSGIPINTINLTGQLSRCYKINNHKEEYYSNYTVCTCDARWLPP